MKKIMLASMLIVNASFAMERQLGDDKDPETIATNDWVQLQGIKVKGLTFLVHNQECALVTNGMGVRLQPLLTKQNDSDDSYDIKELDRLNSCIDVLKKMNMQLKEENKTLNGTIEELQKSVRWLNIAAWRTAFSETALTMLVIAAGVWWLAP